jgi:hypothetical protein
MPSQRPGSAEASALSAPFTIWRRLLGARRLAGTLQPHLEQTGQDADEMWHQIQDQMMWDPDLPVDYGSRSKELERISEVARDLVNHDLIHVPLAM